MSLQTIEQAVARDIRQTQMESEALVEKMARTREVRDFPINRALAQMQTKLDELNVKMTTLRGVAAYMAGNRDILGPTAVDDWLDIVWREQADYHPAATLTGGRVPAHMPGAYPRLSCCGGDIQLVDLDNPAGAGDSVEASRG